MKIRMLSTQRGSPNGITILEYEAGKSYEVPDSLAEIFLSSGWAEEDKAYDSAPEKKIRRKKRKRKKNRTK